MIVDVEVPIARPRTEVFDLMADARNETVWNSQVASSELVSDEPIGLGSRFVTGEFGAVLRRHHHHVRPSA